MLPFCDVLAWCLMPNHFHLMVLVNHLELESPVTGSPTPSRAPSGSVSKLNFNKSVGIMLASYTRAINKQQATTGSLFRNHTKAECINCPKGNTPSFYNTEFGTQIHVSNPEKEYPQVCFNYIHDNPVKAGLVSNPVEWEFSSARDYAGLRNGKLVNKVIAGKYIDF